MQKRSGKAKATIFKKLYQIFPKQKENPTPPIGDIPPYNDLFQEEDTDIAIIFAREFKQLGGNFFHCINEQEAIQKLIYLTQWKQWSSVFCEDPIILERLHRHNLGTLPNSTLKHSHCAITSCSRLIARTGSILIHSNQQDRTGSIYSPNHICIAYTHQIVYDISQALQLLGTMHEANDMPSFFSLISGPSKTADIEKVLVKGVHGPKDIFVFLIDSIS